MSSENTIERETNMEKKQEKTKIDEKKKEESRPIIDLEKLRERLLVPQEESRPIIDLEKLHERLLVPQERVPGPCGGCDIRMS